MKTIQKVITLDAVKIIDFTRKAVVDGGRMGGAITDEVIGKGSNKGKMIIPLTQILLDVDPTVGDYLVRVSGNERAAWTVMKPSEFSEFSEKKVAASAKAK